MYGLVDCNNFFVSCERVFNPALRNRPVVVLSNNDGCIVALSNEAKKLGLRRGNPLFEVEHICHRNNVAIYSGNHRLYGDMSSRVMAILSYYVPDIEIYSIDEAFFRIDGMSDESLKSLGHEIVREIRRCTGIPTSLGLAPTMTLAKIASNFAKDYAGYHSVCLINSDDARRKALGFMNVSKVWGIGRRLSQKFYNLGIDSALQFADMSENRVSQYFNVACMRTWRELNGQPCIALETSEPAKKQMCCSRSFGTMLTEFEDLRNAIAHFVEIVARKLRAQHSAAVSISIFIHTNAYRTDLDQYYRSAYRQLEEATSDTLALMKAATECLHTIYRKGYSYKKAGVIVNEVVAEGAVKQSLFADPTNRQRRRKLMTVLDSINSRNIGGEMVHLASYTPSNNINKSEHRSRMFTTRIDDIITVR